MTCPEIIQLIDDIVDGSLKEKPAQQLREHITSCKSCRDELDRTMRLKVLLNNYSTPEPGTIYFHTTTDLILERISKDSWSQKRPH